jgi:hypothetical protein
MALITDSSKILKQISKCLTSVLTLLKMAASNFGVRPPLKSSPNYLKKPIMLEGFANFGASSLWIMLRSSINLRFNLHAWWKYSLPAFDILSPLFVVPYGF